MSGVKPFFLTGAVAKIKLNGVTLAYCTNITYSVMVKHAESKVLGMYESTSIEPLSYSVGGGFSVIRYIADVKTNNGGKAVQGTSDKGNGLGYWGEESNAGSRFFAGLNPSGADGRAYDNLNPAKLDKATGFDIEIFQKLENGKTQSVAKIRGARITKADFSLQKKSAAMQNFTFSAIYVDEDSFIADTSGLGQNLA
jgi:hypothetical protein